MFYCSLGLLVTQLVLELYIGGLCMWWLINIPCRFVTLFAQDELDVDLRTLRAIRVLRPLKLVSGIPSKLPLTNSNHIQLHRMMLQTF